MFSVLTLKKCMPAGFKNISYQETKNFPGFIT